MNQSNNQDLLAMPFFKYRNSENNKDIQDMVVSSKSKTRNYLGTRSHQSDQRGGSTAYSIKDTNNPIQ